VAHTAQRLKEAEKLGFQRAVLPGASADIPASRQAGLTEIGALADLVVKIAGSKRRPIEVSGDEAPG